MRVNLEWLREWVDVGADGARLAEDLTTLGLEVDDLLPAGPQLSEVVVGEVIECRPHPEAEKLTLCIVDDGEARREVVCGAPNVAPGVKAPFARPGTVLPDGSEIKAVEIRGVESHGMLCSAREIELGDDAAGLMLLDDDAPVGRPLEQYLLLHDEILDIDITPNRGDCFSVIGIAREIGAKRGRDLHSPNLGPVPAALEEAFPVALRAGADCPRFAGRVIRGIQPGLRSPMWLRERLRRAGLRAINPVVDVTNYVMLELGQPLHAYDLNKLSDRIIVRRALPEEKLTLLDGETYTLDEEVLVIADETGAIGMAGVMGGASTSVDDDTTDIFLESAFFTPEVLAGRARRFGLHTDASTRFERGVDPEGPARAIERATRLLLEIAGGRPGPTRVCELADHLPQRPPVRLRHARVESLLGLEIGVEEVEALLARLDIDVRRRGNRTWEAVGPSYRFDLAIEEDLIEEVARMVGYDKIPATPGQGPSHLGSATEREVAEEQFADLLVARGYYEVVTYGFVEQALDRAVSPNAAQLELANPISRELAVMRTSLWPGLLLAAKQNLARQQPRMKLFEIGRQYAADNDGAAIETPMLAGLAVGSRRPEHWDPDKAELDFFDVKADVESLLALTGDAQSFAFQAASHPALHPGQTAKITRSGEEAGWLGTIHPKLQQELELKRPVILFALQLDIACRANVPAFTPYSKFPAVRRDLAVVVDTTVEAEALLRHARAAAGEELQSVVIFDVYTGSGIEPGRKSVALGLILQGVSRTLTDADADSAVGAVIDRLERELGAKIRI